MPTTDHDTDPGEVHPDWETREERSAMTTERTFQPTQCSECGDYKLCECGFVLASINACDAIGATTEALDAGVLRELVSFADAIPRLDEMGIWPKDRAMQGLVSQAREILAKLDAGKGE